MKPLHFKQHHSFSVNISHKHTQTANNYEDRCPLSIKCRERTALLLTVTYILLELSSSCVCVCVCFLKGFTFNRWQQIFSVPTHQGIWLFLWVSTDFFLIPRNPPIRKGNSYAHFSFWYQLKELVQQFVQGTLNLTNTQKHSNSSWYKKEDKKDQNQSYRTSKT